MLDLPCVVFAFNRPDKLERVLKALRSQGIERLIVFVDGPRRPDELVRVEACRKLARDVNWTEMELHAWEQNRGLNGLLDNINLVLEKYPWAVFVEDDCLPAPGFYGFMSQVLQRYRENPQVFSVGAYQPLPERFFKGYPYSVISGVRFMCWGWATWRERWQEALPLAQHFNELFDGLQHVPEIAGADVPALARAVAAGQIKSWATKILLAALALHKVHLLPVNGLVRNTGAGLRGEHSGRLTAVGSFFLQNRNVARKAPTLPNWPEDVSINLEHIRALKDFYFYAGGNLRRRLALSGRQAIHHLPLVRPVRFIDVNLIDKKALPESAPQALVSFQADALLMLPGDPRFIQHMDWWYGREIVYALNRLGFRVDVIDYRDRRFVPRKPYSVFIGVGGNFSSISRHLPLKTKKIFLAYKLDEQFELSSENPRGMILKPFGFGSSNEENQADAVIILGSSVNQQTLPGSPPVFAVSQVSLVDDITAWSRNDREIRQSQAQDFAEKIQVILEQVI